MAMSGFVKAREGVRELGSVRNAVGCGGLKAELPDPKRSRDLIRNIEVSQTQKDQIHKVLNVRESAGPIADLANRPVNGFGDRVRRPCVNESEDAMFVLSNGPGEFAQRLQAA